MNFEEWYAKLGEWAEENTALNMSHAMQRHLARHLEEWEASRPTPRAADDCPQGGSHVYKWDGTLPTEEMVECEKCGHRR